MPTRTRAKLRSGVHPGLPHDSTRLEHCSAGRSLVAASYAGDAWPATTPHSKGGHREYSPVYGADRSGAAEGALQAGVQHAAGRRIVKGLGSWSDGHRAPGAILSAVTDLRSLLLRGRPYAPSRSPRQRCPPASRAAHSPKTYVAPTPPKKSSSGPPSDRAPGSGLDAVGDESGEHPLARRPNTIRRVL